MASETEFDIDDVFMIYGRGLIVIPSAFVSIQPTSLYRPYADTVGVVQPDGTRTEFEAEFLVEHFSLLGGDGRYSVVALLPTATRAEVPTGSKLLIGDKALAQIRREVIVL